MKENNQNPTLEFLGGAGTVTGSKYLIRLNGAQVLLEAGLFQGLKELRFRNWRHPSFDPSRLDAVVLSHAHIDHSGYLPRLFKDYFRGKVFCTSGTSDLLKILLPDSAFLQEEEAATANKYGYSKHKPALPLYTVADAQAILDQVRHFPYGKKFPVTHGVNALFRRAGHILGSASVELEIQRGAFVRLVFSGDVGRWNQHIMRDPEFVPEADILLVESTYGDRIHSTDAVEQFTRIILESSKKGGALIVPSFAVGRTQELIWIIHKLEKERKIPVLPVYIDSPMAIKVTDLYSRHPADHRLNLETLSDEHNSPLYTQKYFLIQIPQESKRLNALAGPCIIIAGSGMATGGRVLHHLKMRLPDPRTTVLLVGFQAAGTRGRSLQEGAQTIRIHGQDVPVKAKVETLDGLSAHGDKNDILHWLSGFKKPPRQTYLVHGESACAEHLAQTIQTELGWKVRVAVDGERVELG